MSVRARWQALADDLLAATARHASPSGALFVLPGPVSASGRWSDGLEGYARTFLLAAFRVAGAGGEDAAAHLDRYRRGLIAGTDPEHPERWPRISERRQAVVEAASVAIGLSETRPWLWDTLDERTRQNTVDWLAEIIGTTGYTNNWTWFQTVIESFLASVSGPWSQDDLDRNAQIQEDLYVGDGWYSDGAGPTGRRHSFDYYAGWAWHVYPLLQARIAGQPLADVHRERLALYLDQARHLVGADGSPLLQGRSLTYRFAMLAPFWAGAIAGGTPLAVGETARLSDRVLSHFLDAGSLDERGLLTIGWHREFRAIRQIYTGSASPYWASKGMLGLLLPDGHPEWAGVEAGREEGSRERVSVQVFDAPGWLVVGSNDGVVRVLNHGSDGFRGPLGAPRADNPFYERIGYSTATSPDLSVRGIADPLESHVALLDTAGDASHRDLIERMPGASRALASRSRVHWLDAGAADVVPDAAGWASLRRGPVLSVVSIAHGVQELRLAWWNTPDEPLHRSAVEDADSSWLADPGPWRLRIGGWALPVAADGWEECAGGARRADGLASTVRGVRGLELFGLASRSGSDPLGEATVTPWVQSSGPLGEGAVVAALVVLDGGDLGGGAVSAPEIQVTPGAVTVRWPDGVVDEVPAAGAVA